MTETTPLTPSPEPVATPRSRRALIIVIIAAVVVVLLLLAAGAWAVASLFLGKNESATASAVAFPSTTISWTELAIDPSNGQKLGAFEFVTALDGLKDAIEDSDLDIDLDDPASNSDLKKSIWDFVVEGDEFGLDDVSLDYDDDVKPWLGSRIAYGALPSDDVAEPNFIVAIQATNVDAGVEAIETLIDDLELDADVSKRNGYVLVSTDSVDLDEEFEDGTLADAELFAGASANAGEWGVLSYWADLGASVALASEASASVMGDPSDRDTVEQQIRDNPYSYVPYPDYDFDLGGYVYNGETYEEFDEYEQAYLDDNIDDLVDAEVEKYEGLAEAQEKLEEQYEGVAAYGVLRFTDGALELSGAVSGLPDVQQASSSDRALLGLPETTMLAISVSGLGDSLDTAFSDENLSLLGSLGSAGLGAAEPMDRDDIVDFFDESLGLEFPDDLDVLFGRQFIVSVDEDVDLDALNGSESGNLSAVPESGVAITIITDDVDATISAWEDLIDTFEDESGSVLGVDLESDGDRVVISAGDYLDTMLDPEDTAGSAELFRRAVPAADGASSVMFVNAAEIIDLVGDLSGSDGVTDYLDGLEAIGFSQTVQSKDVVSYVLRVTAEQD